MTPFPSPQDSVLSFQEGLSKTDLLQRSRCFLKTLNQHQIQDLKTGKNGLALAQERSAHMDLFLRQLLTHHANQYNNALPAYVLCATGGYGKGRLAPYSDLDVMFLTKDPNSPSLQSLFQDILQICWDLNLKIGHACHHPKDLLDLARQDLTIYSTLADCRFLFGSSKLFQDINAQISTLFTPENASLFLQKKQTERHQKHHEHTIGRYQLEPHLKEGQGGLRDLDLLKFCTRFLYQSPSWQELATRNILSDTQATDLLHAEEFIWSVRTALHSQAGRAQEILTLETQPDIAKMLGFEAPKRSLEETTQNFMSVFFSHLRRLEACERHLLLPLLPQSSPKKGLHRARVSLMPLPTSFLKIKDGFLTLCDQESLSVEKILPIFCTIANTQIDIHPDLATELSTYSTTLSDKDRKTVDRSQLFLSLLSLPQNSEDLFKRLRDTGILSWYIPDFTRILGQVQFDRYHTHSVDSHTFKAMDYACRLRLGHLGDHAAQEYKKLKNPLCLGIALLFHDMGKGSGQDHSLVGAKMAHDFCLRLSLSATLTDTVSWLVKEHLLFSQTAQQRDLEDPKTIQDILTNCHSSERLRLLYLLTLCDSAAVGPNRLTSFKQHLLQSLFERSIHFLQGNTPPYLHRTFTQDKKQALKQTLPIKYQDLIDQLPDRYLHSQHVSYIQDHLALLEEFQQNRQQNCLLHSHFSAQEKVWTICCIAQNQPRLFAKITGAFTYANLNIQTAQIYSLKNNLICDFFTLSEENYDPYKIQNAEHILTRALKDDLDLVQTVTEQKTYYPIYCQENQPFPIITDVLIHNDETPDFTLIEIIAPNRHGLLFDIAVTLTQLGLHLHTAHISTYGDKVIDIFYVKDSAGLKIRRPEALSYICEQLIKILG